MKRNVAPRNVQQMAILGLSRCRNRSAWNCYSTLFMIISILWQAPDFTSDPKLQTQDLRSQIARSQGFSSVRGEPVRQVSRQAGLPLALRMRTHQHQHHNIATSGTACGPQDGLPILDLNPNLVWIRSLTCCQLAAAMAVAETPD